RVAGDEGPARRERIHTAPGPRRFGPDSAIWRVHADASMFPGGIRALLLQSLHPLAMAAVDQHSGFRGDPWGRLNRTSAFLAETTFGRTED
ncbi:oxygenase MpaB family protein, partial [Campylobacter fetus subsp. venerealis]